MKKKTILKLIWRGVQIVSYINLIKRFIISRGLEKEEDLKMLIDMVDLLQGNKIEGPDDIVLLDDVELHVSYNPYVHLVTNAIGSIASIYPTGDVIVDNTFRLLCPATQRAILAHELGHIKLGHKANIFYPFKRMAYIFAGKVLEMELEADVYAASIVGNKIMIETLEYLKYFIGPIDKKEIDLRIKALRKEVR